MQLLREFLSFFSLETIDARLFPPIDNKKKQAIVAKVPSKSRWNTTEFKLYGLVFLVCIPLMFKTAMEASNESNPNYPRYAHLLSNGWLFGRKVDNSDSQYRFFRDNFPMLCGLILLHVTLRKGVMSVFNVSKRTYFDFGFGILFLIGAHGTNVFRILIHLLINYAISRIPSRKVAYTLTWVYGILTLFINDNYRNIPFGISAIDNGFKGIIARWDVFFNFTLLRMISFNIDYLEKKKEQEFDESLEKRSNCMNLSNLDERQRLVAPLPIGDYNIVNYLAYISYTPLFIAGPIITFNDFIYQSNYQQLSSVKNYKRTFTYILRFIVCIMTMEFILHFMYVVAVSKTKAWTGDSPFQISMLGYFNLNIIWLKLLIPWRLFRAWALMDGIDPPENMIRCMSNNYSALAFWRAWHRSYNKWIIRYIYVPLGGGGSNRVVNSLFVFSFVAIWHDIELKLLMWGWLVVIFLLPEIIATQYFKRYESKWWYRHLCALGAVVNIWMMMIANLFGFCLGKDGTIGLLTEMFTSVSGLEFFTLSSLALFSGVQVMFELRELENRKGIDVKC